MKEIHEKDEIKKLKYKERPQKNLKSLQSQEITAIDQIRETQLALTEPKP